MGDMATSPRECLANPVVDALGTAANGIAPRISFKRQAALQTAVETLEACVEVLGARLEAEITERQETEGLLRELTVRTLEARDDESRRIARELHDSVGQYLAMIEMNLDSLERDASVLVTTSQKERVSDSIGMVKHCTSEIRTISYLLHPPLLDEMGLASALEWYCDGFAQRSGIRVELGIATDFERLPKDSEIALFRIVQQSLANIYRHSGSSMANITIRQDAEEVTVTIRDQGRGIPPDVLKDLNSGKRLVGVGVAGMRERVRAQQGCLQISSSRDGTTVQVRLPLMARAREVTSVDFL